jgi:hypothetical protein
MLTAQQTGLLLESGAGLLLEGGSGDLLLEISIRQPLHELRRSSPTVEPSVARNEET